MSEIPNDDAEKRRIEDHVKYLSVVIKESQSEYSKQLLSLSSAALGLSAAFYKNLGSPATATWFSILYTAWILFILTIVATLISVKLSISAHKDYRGELRKWLTSQSHVVGSETIIDKLIPLMVWFSTVTFVTGVIAIFAFTAHNIQRERSMSKINEPLDNIHRPSDTHQIPVRDHVEVDRIPTPPSKPVEPARNPPPPPRED